MESEFYTTAEIAAKLGFTYPAFCQAQYRGTLKLPFEGVRFSTTKGKNSKIKWPKKEVDDYIDGLANLEPL